MKHAIIILAISAGFSPANSFGAYHYNRERIEVVFTTDLKYDDLAKIKNDLFEKGLILEYLSLEFDKNKKLKKIKFFVDCKDGYSGSACTTHLSKEKKFGFYRDYTENSRIHFFAGSL